MFLTKGRRRARVGWPTILVGLVFLGGAPAARAEAPLLLETTDGLDGRGSISIMALDYFEARLTVERRGRLIVDQTGQERWPHVVRVPVAPRPGDVIRVYALPTGTLMARTTWAGLPTLDECAIGSEVARGRIQDDPRDSSAAVEAFQGETQPAILTETEPGRVTIDLPRVLGGETDYVSLHSSRRGVTYDLISRVVRRAGQCGRPPQIEAPEFFDARTRLRGGRLISVFDPSSDPRFAYITMVAGCPPRSRVACEGYLRIETLGVGSAPPIRLAQESFSVPAGVLTTAFRLTAGDAVGTALAGGPVSVRVTATTWNQAGEPVVSERIMMLSELNLPYPEPGA